DLARTVRGPTAEQRGEARRVLLHEIEVRLQAARQFIERPQPHVARGPEPRLQLLGRAAQRRQVELLLTPEIVVDERSGGAGTRRHVVDRYVLGVARTEELQGDRDELFPAPVHAEPAPHPPWPAIRLAWRFHTFEH